MQPIFPPVSQSTSINDAQLKANTDAKYIRQLGSILHILYFLHGESPLSHFCVYFLSIHLLRQALSSIVSGTYLIAVGEPLAGST